MIINLFGSLARGYRNERLGFRVVRVPLKGLLGIYGV